MCIRCAHGAAMGRAGYTDRTKRRGRLSRRRTDAAEYPKGFKGRQRICAHSRLYPNGFNVHRVRTSVTTADHTVALIHACDGVGLARGESNKRTRQRHARCGDETTMKTRQESGQGGLRHPERREHRVKQQALWNWRALCIRSFKIRYRLRRIIIPATQRKRIELQESRTCCNTTLTCYSSPTGPRRG